MTGLVGALRRYLFRPAPRINLGIARLLLVGSQLAFLLYKRPVDNVFPELYALQGGYEPVALLRLLFSPIESGWLPPLEFWQVVYVLTIVFGVLAFVGLLTNVTLGLFALGSTMIQAFAYSFNSLHHSEAAMAIALFILALSPCGGILSIDSLISRVRRTIRDLAFQPAQPLEEKSEFARWPFLALLSIISLIYLSCAFLKWKVGGFDWFNGHTLRYYFLQDGIRWDIPFALNLAHHNGLAAAASIGAFAFEGLFFLVLLFPALVPWFALLGIGLHGSIHFLLSATFWELMLIFVALLPWSVILTWAKGRFFCCDESSKPEMVYDGQCYLCLRSMTVIDALDIFGGIKLSAFQIESVAARCAKLGITPLDTRRELHLILPDGKIHRGFFAFRRLCWFMPALLPFAPFFYLPLANVIGPRVYRFVASSRRRFETCENGACKI